MKVQNLAARNDPQKKTVIAALIATFFLYYAVLSNIPFWTATHWIKAGCDQQFGVEYAGVGIFVLLWPCKRRLCGAMMVSLIGVDILCAVSSTYYLSPSECILSIRYLSALPDARVVFVLATVCVALLTASASALLPVSRIPARYRRLTAVWLLSFFVLIKGWDLLATYRDTGVVKIPGAPVHADSISMSALKRPLLFRSSLANLARLTVISWRVARMRRSALNDGQPIDSVLGQLRLSVNDMQDAGVQAPNLVLVVVESWGFENDASIRNAMTSPYRQAALQARYQILEGTVSFNGATLAAEARELCGSDMGFHIMSAPAAELQGCLPDKLRALGYRTTAFHGMKSGMFERRDWYERIGFKERWFEDELHRQGLPDCPGAFTGTCDSDVAAFIGTHLGASGGPEFLYWMTLNSHLPVPSSPQVTFPTTCPAGATNQERVAFCAWYQLIYNVHASVGRVAASASVRPTIFIVVGDHAPPFENAEARSGFSQTVVPYVVLVPRAMRLRSPSIRDNSKAALSHHIPFLTGLSK